MYYQTECWGSYNFESATSTCTDDPIERLEKLVSENAVVVFSVSTCCMCHAVKRLFCAMGVSPTVYELDQLDIVRGKELQVSLTSLLIGGDSDSSSSSSSSSVSSSVVPVVFIGGKLVGGMDRVMSSHINGSLVPLLKEAGALWL